MPRPRAQVTKTSNTMNGAHFVLRLQEPPAQARNPRPAKNPEEELKETTARLQDMIFYDKKATRKFLPVNTELLDWN